ncbi:MAG: reprolysin-like metallopeptidase [Tenacibaculum sp.]
MKKKLFLLFFILASVSIVKAQNYWKKLNPRKSVSILKSYQNKDLPAKYQLFSLNIKNFKARLNSRADDGTKISLSLPIGNGEFAEFNFTEIPVFEEKLAQKYPYIKSYIAIASDNSEATARISIGTNGVHALITSRNKASYFIDPYTEDSKAYIAYYKNDLRNNNGFVCNTNEESNKLIQKQKTLNLNDGFLRTYRIAIASTAEYALYHLNNQNIPATASSTIKKAAVLSAINTTLTRVNQVFENDLAVRMQLVANNDKLIFFDSSSDNLSNNDVNMLINQNQELCDAIIGSANYDIGHVFSTSNGGIAFLGSVCETNLKARGVSGISNPISDPFNIDFVSHEIGHQFGASHTFNNLCNGERSNQTAVEPGSGSTIMGYAGICPPDVQSNSDAYFHSVSIEQIWNTIQNSAGCASQTSTANISPSAQAGNDVSIPISTPFVLKGTANDPDNSSSLSYNWEQIDSEVAIMPPLSSNSAGPMFRSVPPTEAAERYFPNFLTVLTGSTSVWEVLPSVARSMNFSFTVRDNNINGGAVSLDDIKVTTVQGTPFSVSNQVTWAQNTSRIIIWTVGQTNIAPINCKKVNIKLSVNGGMSFDTLAADIDNDGEQEITLPAFVQNTENAILMIEAADNVFYNISNKFTISSDPDFNFVNTTGAVTVCNSSDEIMYNLSYVPINSFSEEVTISVVEKPANLEVEVSQSAITTEGLVEFKVSKLSTIAEGSYTIGVSAESASIQKKIELKFELVKQACKSSGNTTFNTSTTYVNFNTIDNLSLTKDSGYSNYKHLSTNLKKGLIYPLTVHTNTADFNQTQYTTQTVAWIDWNQNCILEADEKFNLGTVTANSNGITSLSPLKIRIPDNAELGTTVMRITTKFNSEETPQACELNFDGEVEDYSIVIEEAIVIYGEQEAILYPNPTNGEFRLTFQLSDSKEVTVKLFDISGKLIEIKHFNYNSSLFFEEISFKSVNKGLYFLQIENGNFKSTKKLLLIE